MAKGRKSIVGGKEVEGVLREQSDEGGAVTAQEVIALLGYTGNGVAEWDIMGHLGEGDRGGKVGRAVKMRGEKVDPADPHIRYYLKEKESRLVALGVLSAETFQLELVPDSMVAVKVAVGSPRRKTDSDGK